MFLLPSTVSKGIDDLKRILSEQLQKENDDGPYKVFCMTWLETLKHPNVNEVIECCEHDATASVVVKGLVANVKAYVLDKERLLVKVTDALNTGDSYMRHITFVNDFFSTLSKKMNKHAKKEGSHDSFSAIQEWTEDVMCREALKTLYVIDEDFRSKIDIYKMYILNFAGDI